MAKQWTAPEILELSSVYWQTFALQAGVALDLFTILESLSAGGEQPDAAALARAAACDPRGLEMLATALTALGFLERSGAGLALPEHSRRYLSRNSEEYVGFIIKHHMDISPAWTRLAEAVKTGGPVKAERSSHTDDENEREAFLMGMFNVAVNQAEKVAAGLDLSGGKRLLDLGGGPGTYAVFFCKANPGLEATIFDRPTTASFALETVRRFGLEGRVDFVGGDFSQDELPRGYDAVWLSQVLHGERPENAAKLVARAGKSLNPGGRLIIQEFVLDDDRSGPAHPALFNLNMLVGTDGGQSYSWSELETMLRSAGAVSVRREALDLPMGCGILTGRLPG
ncbi:MAG: methyltransferase domain-containing protein [Deltaproteobacteria bacterium]|jgi:SAM-dependent methyltransferase|nr:methyltransferase domain-containing protein [Deltaproteobacteria bacterium]